MRRIAFTNGRVVTPSGVLDGAGLHVADGHIVAMTPPDRNDETIDLDGGWLVPGFVDTQVNGGGGVLFNDSIDIDGIRAITAAHMRYGTTGLLVTLISDDPERIGEALEATEAAIGADVPGVMGIHIEGPFLNARRKGIHDASKFHRIDDDMIALLTQPRRGKVMLTLAPETCTPEDISALVTGGRDRLGGSQRCGLCHDPRRAGGRDCAASPICSTPCRPSTIVGPALSARRSTTSRPGAV